MITTCTRCGNAYDSGSEEQANEPERFCPICSLRQQLAGAQAQIETYRLREFASYQALGYSPPVSDALPHLIECMMGLKARLQDSLASIEKATGFQPGTEPLSAWVERMVKERDEAQKACAEMRSELGRIKVKPWAHVLTQEDRESIGRILSSTDCGSGYVPRAELDAAEKNAAYWVQQHSVEAAKGGECEHELINDIWKDPNVKAALKEGRTADDIAVLRCPKCDRWGYYNEGSHFSCRFCKRTWYVCSEDQEPRPKLDMQIDGHTTLADTLTVTTDGYENQTLSNPRD